MHDDSGNGIGRDAPGHGKGLLDIGTDAGGCGVFHRTGNSTIGI